jgi:hypothetical protein
MSASRFRAVSIAIAIAAVALFTLLLAAVVAPHAQAGTYRAVQCSAGAGHGDTNFTSNSAGYAPRTGCAEGRGLSVLPSGRHAKGGGWGAWTITAPAGTSLVGAQATVSGMSRDGHTPQIVVGSGHSARPIGRATGHAHRVWWAGADGGALRAELECERAKCPYDDHARITVRRIALKLSDTIAPAVTLAGSLFDPGSRRGPQVLDPTATDAGSGVAELVVEVNGQPIGGHNLSCALASGTALRVRPCPAKAAPSISTDTTTAPFVQGPNTVRVCAVDYARHSTANRACADRSVRIDNACPLSPVPDGSQMDASIRGRDHAIVHRTAQPVVSGRVVDTQGSPVAGARVCLATTADLPRAREHVVATPTTGANGTFSARLPAGPDRQVRVAYWPDENAAVERTLSVDDHADPTLRLRPRRLLHNGDTLGFAAHLPGPRNDDRQVVIQVRVRRHWTALRSGRTNRDGSFRASYRFHATTGRRTYSFRAVVPEQGGYPYLAGRSPVRHARVSGRRR